ncbi:MAG: iron-containing alcohol dehydrogenase [Planctomycetota bacterium]
MHIPVLRLGKPYTSLDKIDVVAHATGEKLIQVSQVNAGIIRRDLPKYAASRDALQKFTVEELLAMSKKAGAYFMEGTLPLGDGATQSADDYVKYLSASSGLPHNMVRRNMGKVNHLFVEMRTILNGLTRNMDLRVFDSGRTYDGPALSFYPTATALGVVLPSNSPGVNSLWMPSLALKIPVVLKPGREEPWTPFRIIQAFIAAGVPAEAFGFYPTDHEGAAEIVNSCGRALLFGDDNTTARWANNPNVNIHGPGRSKIIIGDDCIENWRDYIGIMADSICQNGGRSCVNASAVVVPKYAKEIADELGKRLAPIAAAKPDDPNAALSAFANVKMAEYMDSAINDGLNTPGAEDVTMRLRGGVERKQLLDGGTYMRPTLIHCENFDHPLANREFLFPYASVVEMAQAEMLPRIGHSLVVTAITKDEAFIEKLLATPLIDRLNVGPVSTMQVAWDQPHEGNLFEFLYKRRAIVYSDAPKKTAPAAASFSPTEITEFNFHSRTRLVFGTNSLESLGKYAVEYGAKTVLIVTDAGIAAAGHAARAEAILKKEGLAVHTFDRAKINPSTREVSDCVEFARDLNINFIVGLGGGSSMDTAKGANFILTNGGKMADYWGINKATKPMLPMIAVPTTAGTGSEAQCYALVADEHTHQKMACGDDKAYPVVALLDPALSVTCPRAVTAATGIDAISHAIESYVCSVRNPVSQLFSREAWKLANGAFETVLSEPSNLEARGQMLLASAYAGLAISQSMLGATHSAANPLTANFDVLHGRAIAIMLPHVIAFNAKDPQAAALYTELAHVKNMPKAATPVQALIARINGMVKAGGLPANLDAVGVSRDAIGKLSDEAAQQWTAKFNPRTITAADFKALYDAAFGPGATGVC